MKWRNAETELWDFENNETTGVIIDPTLAADKYAVGVGLYEVTVDFCRKQWSIFSAHAIKINWQNIDNKLWIIRSILQKP